MPVAGVGAGQAAQHHHPRHEAEIGVRFAGSDKLVHLIGNGEASPRLGRGFAERLDGATQIGQDFGNGNQLATLTLHALFSHRTQIASFSVRPIENLRNFRRIDLVMGQSLTSGPPPCEGQPASRAA